MNLKTQDCDIMFYKPAIGWIKALNNRVNRCSYIAGS